MNSVKKVLALALVAVMMLALAIPAMAEGYTITIDNAVADETYSAYKVFDVTYANPVNPAPTIDPATDIPGAADNTHFNSAYAYSINTNSMFWGDLTTGVTADADGVYSLTDYGLKFVDVMVKGPGSGREAAIRALQTAGLEVTMIKDVTPIPHNGCRPPKRRRV